MKWGCNYSKALMKMLQEGQLQELDYIKAGAFWLYDLEEAFSERPLLLHGFGWYERIGMDFAKAEIAKELGGTLEKAIQRMNELSYYYESPHLAFHCLAYEEDMQDFTGTPAEKNEQLYRRMKENLLFLKERLDAPVLIENIDYCPFYDKMNQKLNEKYPVLPEVISALVEETGVGFLFDLSHARVSAEHLGMDILEYCRKLPLDKTVEIHLSGSRIHPEYGRIDVHEEMEEEDYALIESLFKDNVPPYITLEYGFPKEDEKHITSPDAIARQMKKLQKLFGGRNKV